MIRYYNAEVVVDSDKANLIELTTRNHSHDDDESVVWFTERRRRITSSNVRTIVKRRSTTPVACIVNQLLYSTFHGNSTTRWGLDQEQHTVGVYTSWLYNRGSPNPIVNIKCGLVVCTAHTWLAATPDGWVTDPEASPSLGLVEFKNPYSYRDLSVSDAIAANECDCLAINNGHIELKRTHSYYYQVQMAKFCTKREWCDFILRTTIDYHCERVQFDESFMPDFSPLCTGSTLRRFYLNWPLKPSQSGNQRSGLPMKRAFFKRWRGLWLERLILY